MNCYPELTYSIYADGELPSEEARQVELHLGECPRCRELVEELRSTDRLLAELLLADAEEGVAVPACPALPARAARLRGVLRPGAAVLAGAAGLQALIAWMGSLRLPPGYEWLNPLRLDLPLSVLFYGLRYSIEEETTMFTSVIGVAGALALVFLFLAGGWLLLRGRVTTVAVLLTLIVVLGLARPGYALEKRTGKGTITVAAGQTVDDTLFAAGDAVFIDGVVTGNLMAFARRVSIKGTVKGDVICFAQTLDVEGTVGGNVFSFSQWADTSGHVVGSTVNFGQSVSLRSAARVDGDAISFAAETHLDGAVGRDASIAGGPLDVRGNIGRNLSTRTDRVTLAAPARVGGNLDAYVPRKENVRVDSGATVAGKSETRLRLLPAKASRYWQWKFYAWEAVCLAGALLIGLLLHWLFPAAFTFRADALVAILRKLGVGFLILVATPIAAVLVAITLIGLPLGLIALGLWLLGLYLAKIFVAAWIGQELMEPPAGKTGPFVLALLAGLVVVFVAMGLPYVGSLLHFLIFLMGLGIAFSQIRGRMATTSQA
jgi:cytoskeletal protein CcmA (bactofilin family)